MSIKLNLKLQTIIVLLLFHLNAEAQTCNCLDELKFVRQHMEKNHPGFNSTIRDTQQREYRSFVQSLEKKIAAETDSKYCIAFLRQYLLYLKDHHINIRGNSLPVREDSLPAMEAFMRSAYYRSTERIPTDSAAIVQYLERKGADEIEGIYRTPDDAYAIALIRNETPRRDYAGVILNSRTPLWQKGQVKVEVKKLNDSIFEIYTYLRNHSLNYDQYNFRGGGFRLPGWQKVSGSVALIPADNAGLVSFSVLDSNTSYISIRSFGGQYTAMLDSFYKAVLPQLTKRGNLIIDVRNNGGGSDLNYKALMPLLYTGDPVIHDIVDLYATPDNIKAYRELRDLYKAQPAKYGADGYNTWEVPLQKMQDAKPYSFTPFGTGKPGRSTYQAIKGNPQKVVIMVNGNCASSCESFLFEARFSSKTTTIGENSGGYTGYGNVMEIKTPCGNSLNWTTMRYRTQLEFEFTGIPPDHRIPANVVDWVDYARKLLN